MMDLFSDDMRREPFGVYRQMRAGAPVFHLGAFDVWMVFDFEGVRRVLVDHEAFGSDLSKAEGQGNPGQWFIFFDPPRHTKLRGLIAKAFVPRMVGELEGRVREISGELLDGIVARGGEVDLAGEFAVPLPMRVIAEMLGVPSEEWGRYRRWSDVILKIANSFTRDAEAAKTIEEYRAVTGEMREALPGLIERGRASGGLLGRLVEAEVEGERLSSEEVLGFVQLLLVAGQETTANLINNAVLCFAENAGTWERVKADRSLLAGAIEEVLRYRSPVQWMPRATAREVEVGGVVIPKGKLVMAVIGSANRDEKAFVDAGRFDVGRSPNGHMAFGFGIHACLGAALSRMEARVALGELMDRVEGVAVVELGKWEPRKALHVHGPSRLGVRLRVA